MTDAPHEDDGRAAGTRPTEEMRLRANRAPVTRLSRKVLLGLALAAAVGVRRRPFWRSSHSTQTARRLYNTNNRNTPDGLANLPRDYTGLPKRLPSLDHRSLAISAGRSSTPARRRRACRSARRRAPATEEQRIAQERKRRAPAICSRPPMSPRTTAPPLSPDSVRLRRRRPPDRRSRRAGSQARLLEWQHRSAHDSPDRIQPPASQFMLQAGGVIPPSLITGLRSDLPGQVTAQVTEDVYDSPTGKFLLIPQGARLVGQYDAQIAFGQSRALLVWNRLIMPNGRSIVLERQPGADPKAMRVLRTRSTTIGACCSRRRSSRRCSASDPRPAPATTRTISSRRSGKGLAELQPGRRTGCRTLAERPADHHHPAGISGAGDGHPRLVLEPYRG